MAEKCYDKHGWKLGSIYFRERDGGFARVEKSEWGWSWSVTWDESSAQSDGVETFEEAQAQATHALEFFRGMVSKSNPKGER